MIHYIKHTEIDKARWDASIAESSNGLIYAYSWYLDIVCPDWDALIENDYEIVMPLPRKKKYGIAYLFPPFFVQQLGIFSPGTKLSQHRIHQFIDAIPAAFRYVEMNLNTKNQISLFNGNSMKKNLTHHVRLDKSYELLQQNYSANVMRNIKKAGGMNYKVSRNYNVKEIISLFRKNKGRQINTLKTDEYNMFEKLCRIVKIHHALDCMTIIHEDKIIAGLIVFKSNEYLIMIFSAVNEFGKTNGAMHYLIDQYLCYASQQYPGKIFDFEGSNDKALARFYKSFGSTEVQYSQLKINKLPAAVKWLKR